MIPPRRLSTLLNQALDHQHNSSFYYVEPTTSASLLSDVKTDRSQFPLVMSARLQHHEDEVWNIGWSHSGEFLASVGKDKLVIIWRIGVSTFAPRSESRKGVLKLSLRLSSNRRTGAVA